MTAHNDLDNSLQQLPNGSGAAAILSAGVGMFAIALIALVADKVPGFKNAMIFYRPTGPLSGVTTLAIGIWLAVWATLHVLWRHGTVSIKLTNAVAYLLLLLSLLLTFPPIADLF